MQKCGFYVFGLVNIKTLKKTNKQTSSQLFDCYSDDYYYYRMLIVIVIISSIENLSKFKLHKPHIYVNILIQKTTTKIDYIRIIL